MILRRSLRRVGSVLLVGGLFVVAAPAQAHEGEASGTAIDLVRQAIALVVNEPGKPMAAREKIADAQQAEDRAGVDLGLVAQADAALAAGDVPRGRDLLEASIGARPLPGSAEPAPVREVTGTAPGETTGAAGAESVGIPAASPAPTPAPPAPMPMATGAESGTSVVTDPLVVRPRLDARDWSLLGGSTAIGLFAVYLALRARPRREVAA